MGKKNINWRQIHKIHKKTLQFHDEQSQMATFIDY